MNFPCEKTWCDNNTGLTNECMFGMSKDLVKHAKSGKPMCECLRDKVLKEIKELEEVLKDEGNDCKGKGSCKV